MPKQAKTIKTSFISLLPYLKTHKWLTAFFLLGQLLEVSYFIFIPFAFRLMIDYGVVNKEIKFIILLTLALAAGLVLQTCIRFICTIIIVKIGAGISKSLRHDVFLHLQKLSLDFYQRTPNAQLLSIYSEEITAILNAIAFSVQTALPGLTLSIIAAVLLFFESWQIGLLVVGIVILTSFLPQLLKKSSERAIKKSALEKNKILVFIDEFLRTRTIISLYGLNQLWQKKIETHLDNVYQAERKENTLLNIRPYSIVATTVLNQLFVVAISTILVIKGKMTIGTVFSIIIFTEYFLSFSNIIALVYPYIAKATAALQRIDAILAEKPSLHDAPSGQQTPLLKKHIVFNNVNFTIANHKILSDIQLTIPINRSIGIVGPSGSGKSTILNLLLKLIQPSSGSIILDDTINLKDVLIDSWRETIGVVTQESLLFNLSIKENILMGCLSASEEDIEKAAHQAGLHEDIMNMSDAYQTLIGEQGNKLSGGQKQRLAIARAMIRKPRILILDEITSSLDAATEAEILLSIKELAAHTTIITVTHRLSICAAMDSIYVMKKGHIVEYGNHHQLLEQAGLYKSLWLKQNSIILSPDKIIENIDFNFLKSISVLRNCDDAILKKVMHSFSVEYFSANQTVFNEESYGDKIFIIARGTAGIYKRQHQDCLAILEEGDIFGEMALITHQLRNATIVTLTPCTFLVLNQENFIVLLKGSPGLRENVERLVHQRRER